MKANTLFLLFLMLFTIASCDKNGDPVDEEVVDNNPDNAPDKIFGKSLVLYNSKMQYTLQASGFTSKSTCAVVMLGGVYKLTSTPTYIYSKSTAKSASLEVKYADKLQIGSDYTNTNSTYTATLSFTSESGGSYTGTEKAVSNSNVSGLNGTTSRNISGTFTLY